MKCFVGQVFLCLKFSLCVTIVTSNALSPCPWCAEALHPNLERVSVVPMKEFLGNKPGALFPGLLESGLTAREEQTNPLPHFTQKILSQIDVIAICRHQLFGLLDDIRNSLTRKDLRKGTKWALSRRGQAESSFPGRSMVDTLFLGVVHAPTGSLRRGRVVAHPHQAPCRLDQPANAMPWWPSIGPRP